MVQFIPRLQKSPFFSENTIMCPIIYFGVNPRMITEGH